MAESFVRKVNGIYDNHTARIIAPVVEEPGMKDPDDIVDYAWKKKVTKVGDGDEDYVVEEVVKEVSRVNRQAFIAKDASDVGVLNILEKVTRSGDLSLVDQLHFVADDSGEVDSLGRPLGTIQDYSNVPGNVGEAINAIKSGSTSFEALKEIFGDISFDTLASMSTEQLTEVFNKYIASHSGASEQASAPEEGSK